MTDRLKILLITGWGRSGSTVLANLVGQLEGFVAVGELRHIWDRALMLDKACACSRPFRECVFWSSAAAFLIQKPREEIERILHLRERFRTNQYVRGLMGWGDSRARESLLEYAGYLEEIYRRVQSTADCRVIVDSTKVPTHAYVLSLIPDVELHVIHLIRDPRAVAFSWSRKKLYSGLDEAGPRYIRRRSPIDSSVHWVTRNLLAEHLCRKEKKSGRYCRLRYEDFVEDPRGTVEAIRDFVGEDSPVDLFESQHVARVNPTHMLSGNPSRFHSGTVVIQQDTEWSAKMPRKDRLLASLVALPLLPRYGYPLFGDGLREAAAITPSASMSDAAG